jgi:hypothetical protein
MTVQTAAKYRRRPEGPKPRNTRRAAVRRFNDIFLQLKGELRRDLSAVETEMVRQAATLMLHAEQCRSRVVDNKPLNADRMIRSTSEARRIIARLQKRPVAKAISSAPPLRERLAVEATAPVERVEDGVSG